MVQTVNWGSKTVNSARGDPGGQGPRVQCGKKGGTLVTQPTVEKSQECRFWGGVGAAQTFPREKSSGRRVVKRPVFLPVPD